MLNSAIWLRALAVSCALLPNTATATLLPQHFTDVELAEPHQLPELDGRRPDNPTRRARQAYIRQNVLPVVRQQRQKLEAQLSAADKTQLETYRGQLRELRQRGKALRQRFGPAGTPQGQRPELTDAQKQQMQQLRTERRAIVLNVKRLAQKYEAQISQLAEEVQPQREQWANDLRALHPTHRTPEQQQRLRDSPPRPARQGQNFFGPARFLLLRPNEPAATERPGRAAALYPNPAFSTQRLDYDVRQDGPVKVELLDERGKTLRTLFEGKQSKGAQTLDVNLTDLSRGTYFYKITSQGHTETSRLVKE